VKELAVKKNLIVVAALAALSLAGCTSMAAAPRASAPAGANRPSVTSAADPASSASSSPASSATASKGDDGVAAFGSAFTWADGLSITVSRPATYTPSKYAATGKEFTHFVVFDVVIVNKTGAVWDPSMVYATLQSANQEGDRVFDSSQLPPEPSTKLLDGREVKFKMAFGVADPVDLVLELRPDFKHDSVIFHG
jgi:hypothetical protein